jgi:hypothetical protein
VPAELILAPSCNYRYAVARQVKAQDSHGNDVRLAIVFIEFENGFRKKVAIREDFIAWNGEQTIEQEVAAAVAK